MSGHITANKTRNCSASLGFNRKVRKERKGFLFSLRPLRLCGE